MVVAPHQAWCRLHWWLFVGAAMLLVPWADVSAQRLQAALHRQLPASFLSTSSPANGRQVPAAVVARCLWSW